MKFDWFWGVSSKAVISIVLCNNTKDSFNIKSFIICPDICNARDTGARSLERVVISKKLILGVVVAMVVVWWKRLFFTTTIILLGRGKLVGGVWRYRDIRNGLRQGGHVQRYSDDRDGLSNRECIFGRPQWT
jgi:hypothetical protein